MMQYICIGDAVYRRVRTDSEKDRVRDNRKARLNTRDHAAGAQRFDKQDEGQDGQDVVVRGERRQPVNGEVADPDY